MKYKIIIQNFFSAIFLCGGVALIWIAAKIAAPSLKNAIEEILFNIETFIKREKL